MKFLLISPKNRTVYNFRGDLIKEIIKRGYEVVVTGPDRTDVEKIEELGARFVEIPMNKTGTNILSDFRYFRALWKLMKREKPDVTLGYTVKPVTYGTLAAFFAKVKNINCLVTGGGYTFTSGSFKARILGFIVRRLYKTAFRKASSVIFQNPDDRDEFVDRRLVRESKCRIVGGSGVNTEHFSPLPFPEGISFFMLSRLLYSKGVKEYLCAAEKVKSQFPQTKFYLLGKYETDMQDAIPKEYVEDFIGRGIVERFEETHDVRPYYAKCSVYVLPSYREGTPRTVLEAMACGRPIITTDANGCRDTVINGQTGFLVPVRDAEAIAEKMIFFINNPEHITLMGKASNAYCKEKFDVNKVNGEMLSIMKI